MPNSPFWTGKDAVNRPVVLLKRPERIISLCPSQTELLVDLGVAGRLIGRTRYCIHPAEKLENIGVIGGTKRIDLPKIEALKPDFFLAEKEENPEEMVNSLAEIAPVYVTDVTSVQSAILMCRQVGTLIGLKTEGERLAAEIEAAMAREFPGHLGRVLYLIWKKPWMAAGRGTFIHSCLEQIGFQNVITSERYPELDADAIARFNPERIFLSSEPFPFREEHIQELQTILPQARIALVDGELFSWYGSRMLKMPAYWRTLK